MADNSKFNYDYNYLIYWNDTDNATSMDSYYYDYDYTMDGKDLAEFILVAAFYCLIFLLGITGNSLVIYCIAKYKRMKSITNQLLLSLACADLLLTLICVPVKLAKLISFEWILGGVMCSLTHYIQTLSMVTSIMTLTAISLERYYAISRPLRAKYICTASHARSVIVAIWITASILSLPILFVQKHYKTGLHDPVYWCDKYTSSTDKKGQLLTIAFEVYMLSLLFLLPVITMAIAYAGVCIELWAVTESVNQSGGGRCSKREGKLDGSPAPSEIVDEKLLSKTHNRDAQVRGQVLKMLFMVVIIFIICWCPILSYNLAVAMGTVVPYFPQEYPYAKPMNTAFSLLAYCNSCLNPIVYGFMSRYFRKSFKQALSLCCMLKRYKQHVYLRKAFTQNDRSSSSTRKPGEQTYGNDAPKATITTMAADSSLSRSPPISPNNSYPRQ